MGGEAEFNKQCFFTYIISKYWYNVNQLKYTLQCQDIIISATTFRDDSRH